MATRASRPVDDSRTPSLDPPSKQAQPENVKTRPKVHEHGFTVLSEGSSPIVDIFFIHGIRGHPQRTWTYNGPSEAAVSAPVQESKSRFGIRRLLSRHKPRPSESPKPISNETIPTVPDVYWPSDLLPRSLPHARILTFGYDSQVTNWFKGPAMQLDVFSYGETLLNGLEAHRRADPERHLIFVVHSLGGLILKDALRRARSHIDQRFNYVYSSVKAIVFFGTPHRGGSYVNLALTVRKLVALSGFDTNDKLLRQLQFDSSVQKLLREEFAKMLEERKPRVLTLQEGMGLTGFGGLNGKYLILQNYTTVGNSLFERLQGLTPVEGILASLYIPETQERFDQVEDAYENTCEWVFDKKFGFGKWLKNGKGIFWISGKPGSGKSTLMKFIISNPRTQQYLYMNKPGYQLLWAEFFFSNRGHSKQKTLEGLYHRILNQLINQAPALVPAIRRIYEDHAAIQGNWSLIFLEAAMKEIVRQREVKLNICLFIDALDEQDQFYSHSQKRLLEFLSDLIKQSNDKYVRVMLCLASRPEPIFTDHFSSWPGIKIHEHTQNDVSAYVYGNLNKYISLRDDLKSDTKLVEDLNDVFGRIVSNAEGVFLWVKLVTIDLIEGLTDGDSLTDIVERFSAMPAGGDLHRLYELILLSLKDNYLHEAFLMLQIAYAAMRPFPLDEFFEAVQFSQGQALTKVSGAKAERRLLSRCRGFLEIQNGSWRDDEGERHSGRVVQFLHQSVRDYLAKHKSLERIRKRLDYDSPKNGHYYLLKFRVRQHLKKYRQNPILLRNKLSFDLRSFDVFYQARMVEQTSKIVAKSTMESFSNFVDSNMLGAEYMKINGWKCPDDWNPQFLDLAVSAGLLLWVAKILKSGLPRKEWGRPLLHFAAVPSPPGLCTTADDPFIFCPAMIKLLRAHEVDFTTEFEGLTAFGQAFVEFTRRGSPSATHMEILETLLEQGSNPNCCIERTPEGSTRPLQVALRKADFRLITLLLEFGASVEHITNKEWDGFEKYNKPMFYLTAFRNRELRARDMVAFDYFYSQDDDDQKIRTLLKQHGENVLSIIRDEVYVIDWGFILKNEPSLMPLIKLYPSSDHLPSGLPKPLSSCSMITRARVLSHWVDGSKADDHWE